MTAQLTVDAYHSKVGQEVGLSSWRLIDQPLIDGFAAVTHDHQYIHVDPARAATTPFGGTIAHGMLVLSLIVPMGYEVLPVIQGRVMGINYGFERVRFTAPVLVGSQLRGRFVLSALERRNPTQILTRYAVTVECDGTKKPVAIADWMTMSVLGSANP